MAFCIHCGTGNLEIAKFCKKCGKEIDPVQVQPEEPSVTDPNLIGKTCPYCQAPIKQGEDTVECPACAMPHHQECWTENNNKCTTFGCGGKADQQVSVSTAPIRQPNSQMMETSGSPNKQSEVRTEISTSASNEKLFNDSITKYVYYSVAVAVLLSLAQLLLRKVIPNPTIYTLSLYRGFVIIVPIVMISLFLRGRNIFTRAFLYSLLAASIYVAVRNNYGYLMNDFQNMAFTYMVRSFMWGLIFSTVMLIVERKDKAIQAGIAGCIVGLIYAVLGFHSWFFINEFMSPLVSGYTREQIREIYIWILGLCDVIVWMVALLLLPYTLSVLERLFRR